MEKLKRALKQLDLNDDVSIVNKFETYMDELLEWNEKINLTAIRDRDEFIKKHYIDSLLCSNCKEFSDGMKIIDVGTGGGFPGVPLAITAPDKEFVLMDSLNKRLKVIDEIANHVGLSNVTILHGRAEELSRNKAYRERFDVCVSRAVANLSTLSEYCLPFVKVGGYFIAYKGPDIDKELGSGTKAIELLGGKIERIYKPKIEGFEFDHNLLFIKKIRKTPAKFPRKAGIPTKEPII